MARASQSPSVSSEQNDSAGTGGESHAAAALGAHGAAAPLDSDLHPSLRTVKAHHSPSRVGSSRRLVLNSPLTPNTPRPDPLGVFDAPPSSGGSSHHQPPHGTPRSGNRRLGRRRAASTAQVTTANKSGVENNVRRLVEYFVVVSSVPKKKKKRQQPGTGASTSQSPAGGVNCDASPPSPASASDRLRPTEDTLKPHNDAGDGEESDPTTRSPKVQQRIQSRRVHLPDAPHLPSLPDASESASGAAAAHTADAPHSQPQMERKKLKRPGTIQMRARSCAAAIEDNQSLRLPVLDNVNESMEDDESDDDGDAQSSGMTPKLDDDRSRPPNLQASLSSSGSSSIDIEADAEESGHEPLQSPPPPPISSLQPRWIREGRGGAAKNIREPGHGGEESSQRPSDLYFEPQITSRYPEEDYPDNPLNPGTTHFCNPSSDVIELTRQYRMPHIHHFVLTNGKGRKIYGTCLTVYEEWHPPEDGRGMSKEEWEALEWYRSHAGTIHASSGGDGGVEVSLHRNDRATLYLPRMICLLSTWPYLTAFREYLTQLYRLATSTDQMTAPLERYVLNICQEVPAPPPGAFEIRMDILNSAIRFWAPPANQPIPYVALPFGVLFECLDIGNVLFVWYSLAVERKVLLVSSQCSLLTICAEILCSLLFPMKWSHLYIPTIPRFLTPMLDAPMPYLCGITRENLAYAVGDIGDETIVVDLDQNVITMGCNTPDLPPIPYRRRFKLETALELHAGDVFWNARGLTKDQVSKLQHGKKNSDKERLDSVLDGADQVWEGMLSGFDEAFNLVYEPDSPNLLNDEALNMSTTFSEDERDGHQSQWDAVQEAFLRFYVAMLKGYRRFLTMPDTPKPEILGVPPTMSNWSGRPTFHSEEFVSSQRSDFQPFLQELVMTQQFDDFITKRMYNPGEPDVIFFDQSIDEKKNRSKLKLHKVDTPVLHSAKAHKVLNTVYAVEPNAYDLPGDDETDWSLIVGGVLCTPKKTRNFVYSTWPEKFDPALFGKPRPIPQMINAEFDRQSALAAKIRANYVDVDEEEGFWEMYGSECDPSPEVATFTVFYLLYSALIGRELREVEEKIKELKLDNLSFVRSESYKSTSSNEGVKLNKSPVTQPDEVRDDEEDDGGFIAYLPECPADICCGGFSIWTIGPDCNEIPDEEETPRQDPAEKETAPRQKYDRFDQVSMYAAKLEEAHAITKAQLDLAFDTLDMMGARLLVADPDVYKCLMEACGRCGDAEHATELMKMVQHEGLVADSEMYSCFVNAFATNPSLPLLVQKPKTSNGPSHHRKMSSIGHLFVRARSDESARDDFINSVNFKLTLSMSDAGSDVGKSGSDEVPSTVESSASSATSADIKAQMKLKKKHARHRSLPLTKQDDLLVTGAVTKQVFLGESLLNFLYPGVAIDTSGDSCPQCSRTLDEDDIISGWVPCAFRDYTTSCPQCKHRFVPRFSVSCTSPTFMGSQGKSTPLYCEFLSPWVMRKELHNLLRNGDGIERIMKPEWRSGTDINATIWWNVIVAFRRYKLPVSFLLQGSFKNGLILPAPEE